MRVDVRQEILPRVGHVLVVEPAGSCVSNRIKKVDS